MGDLRNRRRAARALARTQERKRAELVGVTAELEPAAWRGDDGAMRAMEFFEEAVGAPVRLAAWGPSATDVRARGRLFG